MLLLLRRHYTEIAIVIELAIESGMVLSGWSQGFSGKRVVWLTLHNAAVFMLMLYMSVYVS